MAISFHAHDVAITPESWGLTVSLGGESTEEEDFYLMLQRKRQFSEQDVRFGMADVYIELCGQGMSWYGHIDEFGLRESSVRVLLSHAAAAEKNIEREVVVSFPAEHHSALAAALKVIFEDKTYYGAESAGA